jgi:hypothetical protein
MNSPTVAVTDSTRDLMALVALTTSAAAGRGAEPQELSESWFAEPEALPRTSSWPPPVQKVGEFLGDPEVDAWLR